MEFIISAIFAVFLAELYVWHSQIANWLLKTAVRRLPMEERERLQEEWLHELGSMPSSLWKLVFAVGLLRAAWKINFDFVAHEDEVQDATTRASLLGLQASNYKGIARITQTKNRLRAQVVANEAQLDRMVELIGRLADSCRFSNGQRKKELCELREVSRQVARLRRTKHLQIIEEQDFYLAQLEESNNRVSGMLDHHDNWMKVPLLIRSSRFMRFGYGVQLGKSLDMMHSTRETQWESGSADIKRKREVVDNELAAASLRHDQLHRKLFPKKTD